MDLRDSSQGLSECFVIPISGVAKAHRLYYQRQTGPANLIRKLLQYAVSSTYPVYRKGKFEPDTAYLWYPGSGTSRLAAEHAGAICSYMALASGSGGSVLSGYWPAASAVRLTLCSSS